MSLLVLERIEEWKLIENRRDWIVLLRYEQMYKEVAYILEQFRLFEAQAM